MADQKHDDQKHDDQKHDDQTCDTTKNEEHGTCSTGTKSDSKSCGCDS